MPEGEMAPQIPPELMEMIQELGEETSEALIGLCTAAGEITTGQLDELIQCLSKAKMVRKRLHIGCWKKLGPHRMPKTPLLLS